MHKVACAILAIAMGPAFAAGEIVPTGDPGSDCVAAKISTAKTSKNRTYDEKYCAINKQPTAYANCLRNTSLHDTVSFFTDRCNAEQDGAYVSFNGETHRVWRHPGKAHRDVRYAGKFKGRGVEVQVIPTKLIGRFADESTATGFSVSYDVDVVITYKGETVRISGNYDDSL